MKFGLPVIEIRPMCGVSGDLSYFKARHLRLVHDDKKSSPCGGCDVSLDLLGRPVFNSTDKNRSCLEYPRTPVSLSDVGVHRKRR
jgi:hypothetical protein